MDKELLVTEIRGVLTCFNDSIFNVNMAMLLKDIDYDTYTFIVASKFLDLLSPYEATKKVAQYFYDNLSKEAFSMISRINIVSTYDTSVQMIYRAMYITNGIAYIKKSNFFGVKIDDAIILESHRD